MERMSKKRERQMNGEIEKDRCIDVYRDRQRRSEKSERVINGRIENVYRDRQRMSEKTEMKINGGTERDIQKDRQENEREKEDKGMIYSRCIMEEGVNCIKKMSYSHSETEEQDEYNGQSVIHEL